MPRLPRFALATMAALGSTVLLAPPVFADGGVVVSPGDADGLYESPSIDLGAVTGGTHSNPGRPGSSEPGGAVVGGVPGPPLGLSWSAPGSGVPEWFTTLPEFRFPDFGETPAPPSPGVLAGRAAEQLQLPLPTPSHSPDVALPDGRQATVVGEHTWFWTEPARWEPVSQRVQTGAVWAEVTASPVGLSFDPGNQSLVSCPGPGTPYDRGFGVHAPSPDCDVVYQRSSADEPGEQVRAQWAITWTVSWRGFDGTAPTGGQLPDMTSRATADLAVVEAQALTTD